MTKDRPVKPRIDPTVARQAAVEDFGDWLGPVLEQGQKGTHEMQVSIDDFGRVTIRTRPGYLTISKPKV